MAGHAPVGRGGRLHHPAQTGMGVDDVAIGGGDGQMELAGAKVKDEGVASQDWPGGSAKTARRSQRGKAGCIAAAQGIAIGDGSWPSDQGECCRQHAYAVQPAGRITAMQAKAAADEAMGGAGQCVTGWNSAAHAGGGG